MALLIYAGNRDINSLLEALRAEDDTLDIRVYPQCGEIEDIEFALTWPYPEGLWGRFPNLLAISSAGAGVSHILDDPSLPADIPVLKLVDNNLNQDMWEYLLATISYHSKNLHSYQAQQIQKLWRELPVMGFRDTTVGIVGLGSIGKYVAERLVGLGFKVKGFANSPKQIDGVEVCTLADASQECMRSVDIWVSILPLTEQTRGIFDKSFFCCVKKGAVLINVGRGPQVIEADLIDALDSGILDSTYLDVFATEPLPVDDPLWSHPKVHITPHIASITNPKSVAAQIVNNYKLTIAGKEPENRVDKKAGY